LAGDQERVSLREILLLNQTATIPSDGRADDVFCGNGENDRASVDKEDTVGGCEYVNGKHVAAE
jgi:hypothetical protein